MKSLESKAKSAEQRLDELCNLGRTPRKIIVLTRSSGPQEFDSVDWFRKYPDGYEFLMSEYSAGGNRPWISYICLYVKPRESIFKFQNWE